MGEETRDQLAIQYFYDSRLYVTKKILIIKFTVIKFPLIF